MKLSFHVFFLMFFYFSQADCKQKNESSFSYFSSKDIHYNVLKSIGKSYGYFAFYKTGPTHFLGNFAECPNGLYFQGYHFKNSEAAFQWAKFQLAAEHHQNLDMMFDPEMQQFYYANGEEAFQLRKRFDQKYRGIFPKNWQRGLRDEVMWEILQAKFQQNQEFAECLQATWPFYLLEHNEREGRDPYWSDDSTGHGLNMLGKMLMAIRDGNCRPAPFEDTDHYERIQYAEDFNNKYPYNIF